MHKLVRNVTGDDATCAATVNMFTDTQMHIQNRVPTGFLEQNSPTFPVMEWQFLWHYQNKNPIAQM